jgi:hypothetical protein
MTKHIGRTILAGLALFMTVAAPSQAFADDVLGQWISHTPVATVQTHSQRPVPEPVVSHSTPTYAATALPPTADVEQQWLRQSPQFDQHVVQADVPASTQTSRPVSEHINPSNLSESFDLLDQFMR